MNSLNIVNLTKCIDVIDTSYIYVILRYYWQVCSALWLDDLRTMRLFLIVRLKVESGHIYDKLHTNLRKYQNNLKFLRK